MVGGIYTEERCPLLDCGKRMTDNGKDAVCCPAHPKMKAEKLFVRFGREIKKRFTKYEEAFQFLHGLRFEKWQGKFDKREYVPGQLLYFSTMADKYIEVKRLRHDAGMTAKKTYYAIRNELGLAKAYFGDRNIKDISLIDLEQLFLSLSGLSSKSVYNLRTNLLAFWRWLVKAREIGAEDMPEFPEWEYELGWRKTISKNSQEEILEEVKRLSKKSPRIYLAMR